MREDPGVVIIVVNLDPAKRTWLAVVATSRNWIATLTDPEEIRLAKGRRRDKSRRRIKFGFAILRGIWLYRRERQIKSALDTQRRIATATAG